MNRDRLPIKHELLHRKRIDSLLRRSIESPLVTVVAAPGYGKTQAVAQFVRPLEQRLIWVSLSELDNDVTHFWLTLINALRDEMPELSQAHEKMGFPKNMSEYDMHVRRIVKDLQEGDDVVMVIDNYGQVENRAVRDFLEGFIRLQADHYTAILISSTKGDSDIGWKLMGPNHTSITAKDLRFTNEDCVQYFKRIGLDTTDRQTRKIVEDTEGWPLAIYLIGKRMLEEPGHPDIGAAPVSQLHGFFNVEFFNSYETAYRELLIGLSLLPRFSLDIAKGIMDGSFAWFAELLESNLFINSDYETGLMSFHRLYRDFLVQKGYLLDEENQRRCYSIAGAWFLQHKYLIEAMDCFSKAGLYDEGMKTIESFPAERVDVSLSNYTLRYLEGLPADYAEKHPSVDFYKAYMYMNQMELVRAEAILQGLIGRLVDLERTEDDERILGESYAILGDILLQRNDEGFSEAYRMADYHLPHGSLLHNTEMMGVENNEVFFLPDSQAGAYDRIIEVVFATKVHAERVLNNQAYGFEFLFLAEGQFYRGEFGEAEKTAYQAVFKGGSKAQHDIVCNAYCLLAKIAWMTGDYDMMVARVRDIGTYLGGNDFRGFQEVKEFVQSWFYLIMGEPNRVARWVSEDGQLRNNLDLIGKGRNELLRALYLRSVGRYVEALAYLTQMESIFSEKKLWAVHLRHRVMKASCYARIGDTDAAVQELWEAYQLSYKNGIVVPFAEQGGDMMTLFDFARKQDLYHFDPEWVGSVRGLAAAHVRQRERMLRSHVKAEQLETRSGFALSKREREVLLLLSRGLTREEIGDELNVSINSVKRYIANLYQKLGAVNRADAIRIAATRGDLN